MAKGVFRAGEIKKSVTTGANILAENLRAIAAVGGSGAIFRFYLAMDTAATLKAIITDEKANAHTTLLFDGGSFIVDALREFDVPCPPGWAVNLQHGSGSTVKVTFAVWEVNEMAVI